MIVGVCGFGYSGSGALIDLLKEYEETQVIDDFEFYITYLPDGLYDLYSHLCLSYSRFFDGDVAVKRFLSLTKKMGKKRQYKRIFKNNFEKFSKEYVMDLIDAKWKGFWAYDWYHAGFIFRNLFFRLGIRINNIFNKKIFKYPYYMYLAVEPKNFFYATKEYVKKLLSCLDVDCNKTVVLNQCYPANDPQKCFMFFDSPKAIVVTRDPRDTYVLAKRVVGDDAAWIPTDDVNNFISFYRSQYKKIVENDDVFVVRFEDLIYRYEEIKTQIEQFLNIKLHKTPKTYFDPNISINNTQLFKRFQEYQDDICVIESELKEFLYNFEEFNPVNYSENPF